MRIAITDSLPNRPYTAEREFIRRFAVAAKNVGHEAIEVVTSNDILRCQPDVVLCLHEFTPKLTGYPTFGVMWSPPAFYRHDADRIRSIRSYDAYLVGSPAVKQYLDDLEFSSRVQKPKSDFWFLPASPWQKLAPSIPSTVRSLAYIGVHWDGARHADILTDLADDGSLAVYGPESNWTHLQSGYRGPVPFSGTAVHDILSSHGIALCLHKTEHREADTPSMRLFEAAGAGCVIIADEIPFAKRMLGDAALYVDLRQPADRVVGDIRKHLEWINQNPGQADELARRAHTALNQEYNLEDLISKTVDFATEVASIQRRNMEEVKRFYSVQETGSSASSPISEPLIDIIIRVGGRPLSYVERAVQSVERQLVGTFRILLVDCKKRDDIRAIEHRSFRNLKICYLECEEDGLRSAALWRGLQAVTAPFFAVLDDADQIEPAHFSHLLFAAIRHPEAGFIYGGVIRTEEDEGCFVEARNFRGPGGKQIEETRELKFLDEFNLTRLITGDNYIHSNAWIARKEVLDWTLLQDPRLEFAEDVYLYNLIASKTRFALCNRATAVWNWRTISEDNSVFLDKTSAWIACDERIRLRLQELTYPGTATFSELFHAQRSSAELVNALSSRHLQERPQENDSSNAIKDDSPETIKNDNAKTIKQVGHFKSWLQTIPIYNSYRENRRRLRRNARSLKESQSSPE
ncbi:glycosyltransferase [Hyphomicrobium sp. MC8b]|uniref:glycosyltransferase family protein n=1 Tax=Hyphomicrobium sp. MC8b TaxID=300273 RepID=UPI0039189B70